MIIGICGGTGSGKTTVARRILADVKADCVLYMQQDSYYRNLGDLPPELRHHVNFDHPDALDNDLFINHVKALRAGEAVEMPVYDFTTHTRRPETVSLDPKPILILEGILIFVDPGLRELMDIKIFVDTDADLRFIRRLQRDKDERGRSTESVIKQYLDTVRPMHDQFVEPSKRHADVIIPEGGHNLVGIDLIAGKIRAQLQSELKAASI
ncbi:MAG: uridine kinase [Acidobacteria bacterium]|nr:uridine kinase [Acidobacteriota bacterium]MCW5970164.1 uridine kinase [Blastocatellales bacterium]